LDHLYWSHYQRGDNKRLYVRDDKIYKG
jgi:hypothetical protein